MSFPPIFPAAFPTTHLGSVPYQEPEPVAARLAAGLEIPAWPQLPRRTFRENMYVQYSPSLPGLCIDEAKEKIFFDTRGDLTPALERFYESCLAEAPAEAFALKPEFAQGFYAMLGVLGRVRGDWCKGQVTGPISFGLTVADQDLRASLYHDWLADVIVKNTALNARWQVRQLKAVRPGVIIFVDEPYLASFGSAYISLSREQAISMLDEVFAAVHDEAALAGVHCCGNTDWSVLLATQVDILNLDAYAFLETLALYPLELREFLDRGGRIAWGIVPNHEEVHHLTPEVLATRLREGFRLISQKARARGVEIQPDEFYTRSLIAPSCGLGSASVDVADCVFETLEELGEILRQG